MNPIVKNIFRFCIIVLLQVLILNKINLLWWSQPAGFPMFIPIIYPLFIFLLPYETSVWSLLLSGFVLGITVDTFTNTAGMHAAATVFIAYLRTNVLGALLPRNIQEYAGMQPSVKNMTWTQFLVYTGFLILLHHLVFFSIELWTISGMGTILLKTLASGITSMLFIIAYVLLFTKQSALRT